MNRLLEQLELHGKLPTTVFDIELLLKAIPYRLDVLRRQAEKLYRLKRFPKNLESLLQRIARLEVGKEILENDLKEKYGVKGYAK